ncbi:hypothetical protein AAG906_033120 [Vitis piasezkii]
MQAVEGERDQVLSENSKETKRFDWEEKRENVHCLSVSLFDTYTPRQKSENPRRRTNQRNSRIEVDGGMPEFFFYRMAEKTRMRINGESGKREVGDVCVSSWQRGRYGEMMKYAPIYLRRW